MIKTFRGQVADGGQTKIRLSTKKGKVGYRIVKFQTIPETPGATSDVEAVVKIFKTSQLSTSSTVDFADGNMLAVIYYQDNADVHYPESINIIFDREVFNQDIYITCDANQGNQDMNYYIELEVMNLSDSETQVSTLRDIRQNPQVGA